MVLTYAPKSPKETLFTTLLCVLLSINGFYTFVWAKQWFHNRRIHGNNQLKDYSKYLHPLFSPACFRLSEIVQLKKDVLFYSMDW